MMANFEKKTWVRRESEFPGRRRLDPTNKENIVDVSREEGLILEEGDAFSPENMNGLEERIERALESKADTTELGMKCTGSGILINGGFDIAQRGTSFSTGTTMVYTLDRWHNNSKASHISQDVNTSPADVKYMLTMGGKNGEMSIKQPLNKIVPESKKICLSFWARGVGSANTLYIRNGIVATPETITISTDWKKYSVVLDGATGISFTTGSVATNDSCSITAVKLEYGELATLFYPPDLSSEMQKCQAYFEKSWDTNVYNSAGQANGMCGFINPSTVGQGTGRAIILRFKVEKIKRPSLTMYAFNDGAINCFTNGNDATTPGDFSFTQGTGGAGGIRSVSGDMLAGNIRFHWAADAEIYS